MAEAANVAAVDAAASSQDNTTLKAADTTLKPVKQADLTEKLTRATPNVDEANDSAIQEEKTTVTLMPVEQATLRETEAENLPEDLQET